MAGGGKRGERVPWRQALAEAWGETYVRGLEMKSELVKAEGGSCTVDEAALLLGLAPQAVRERIKGGALIALDNLLPRWQFEEGVLAHLPAVLEALDAQDGWTRAPFFLGPDSRLKDRRPLDALRAGDVAAVLDAARAHGEHGAA